MKFIHFWFILFLSCNAGLDSNNQSEEKQTSNTDELITLSKDNVRSASTDTLEIIYKGEMTKCYHVNETITTEFHYLKKFVPVNESNYYFNVFTVFNKMKGVITDTIIKYRLDYNQSKVDLFKKADMDVVVLEIYSGGAHCCYGSLLYLESDSSFKLIYNPVLNEGESGTFLKNIDNDHEPEIISSDDAFVYFHGGSVTSYFPIIVFDIVDDKYFPSLKLTKEQLGQFKYLNSDLQFESYDYEDLSALAKKIKSHHKWKSFKNKSYDEIAFVKVGHFWHIMIELIYRDEYSTAMSFLDELWGEDIPYKEKFREEFLDRLKASSYINDVYWLYKKDLQSEMD